MVHIINAPHTIPIYQKPKTLVNRYSQVTLVAMSALTIISVFALHAHLVPKILGATTGSIGIAGSIFLPKLTSTPPYIQDHQNGDLLSSARPGPLQSPFESSPACLALSSPTLSSSSSPRSISSLHTESSCEEEESSPLSEIDAILTELEEKVTQISHSRRPSVQDPFLLQVQREFELFLLGIEGGLSDSKVPQTALLNQAIYQVEKKVIQGEFLAKIQLEVLRFMLKEKGEKSLDREEVQELCQRGRDRLAQILSEKQQNLDAQLPEELEDRLVRHKEFLSRDKEKLKSIYNRYQALLKAIDTSRKTTPQLEEEAWRDFIQNTPSRGVDLEALEKVLETSRSNEETALLNHWYNRLASFQLSFARQTSSLGES